MSIAEITPARLATFKTALGQLLNTPLFTDDSAHVDALVEAVNGKVGSREGAYSKPEAVLALQKLDEANNIM